MCRIVPCSTRTSRFESMMRTIRRGGSRLPRSNLGANHRMYSPTSFKRQFMVKSMLSHSNLARETTRGRGGRNALGISALVHGDVCEVYLHAGPSIAQRIQILHVVRATQQMHAETLLFPSIDDFVVQKCFVRRYLNPITRRKKANIS